MPVPGQMAPFEGRASRYLPRCGPRCAQRIASAMKQRWCHARESLSGRSNQFMHRMESPAHRMEQRSPSNRLMIVAALLRAVGRGAVGASGVTCSFSATAEFLARAEHQQQHIVEISAKRADIFDRNVHALAMSASGGFVFRSAFGDFRSRNGGAAAGPRAEQSRPTRWRRGWLLRTRSCGLRASCRRKRRRASPRLNLRGIYFQKEDERFYPKRGLAAPVLGYVDIDERGVGRRRIRTRRPDQQQAGAHADHGRCA